MSENEITLDELRTLIKENGLNPNLFFTKEEILADPRVKEMFELKKFREDEKKRMKDEKEKEDASFIPGPESEEENDDDGSASHIPD